MRKVNNFKAPLIHKLFKKLLIKKEIQEVSIDLRFQLSNLYQDLKKQEMFLVVEACQMYFKHRANSNKAIISDSFKTSILIILS